MTQPASGSVADRSPSDAVGPTPSDAARDVHVGGPHGDPPPTSRLEAICLVVGAIALGAAVIGTRAGVFTPDTRPDLYQEPGRFLVSTLQGWVGGSSGLGQANFNAGAAPMAAVVWVIRTLGASAWLSVRLWRLLLMFLGAWGLRRYLGVLLGRRLTPAVRLVATVFWLVNPYVIVAGNTTPILLPYALLPWTMLAFVHCTRQPRSWRWPAAFALAFFAQTGMNAGVVPFFQLAALPGHLVYARWVEGRDWRDLVRALIRCGVLSVLVSLYWLLPSFIATGTGAGIAGSTENPRDVARTSSYAETARLLGNWPLYGRAGDRLFLASYTTYLTNPLVVVATFAVPIAVGLSLWRARVRERLLPVALLATALPVMVGLFPPDEPYEAGKILGRIFDAVPAALAFRTTNKVGSVVVLAETVAIVLGLRAWQQRTARAPQGRRIAQLGLVVGLLAVISVPLWNGGLYPLGYRIPKSWIAATNQLDEQDRNSRVLVVPGGTGGNYRWGMRSPDDLFPSILARPVAVRNTVVGRGEPSGNLMSGFDSDLAEGSLPEGGVMSVMARYLGASDVLVRNDLLTEEISGPDPSEVAAVAAADPGLVAAGHFGEKGTDTVPNGSGPATPAEQADDPDDAALYPIQLYRVRRPQPVVRAAPAEGQMLVDGDGDAISSMVQADLVDGTQPLRLLGDLDKASFAAAASDGGHVVLTDTNRRRAWDINRVGNATTQTLPAGADIDSGNGTTTTRWPDDPSRQTVTVVDGAARVGADRPGFGVYPFGRPSNAFDGDPNTAWITGGFHTAAGKRIFVDLPRERTIRRITLLPYPSEPSSIASVSITVGTKTVFQALPPDGKAVDIPIQPTRADRVEVRILRQTPGQNPVGFSEIGIGSFTLREVTRLPETFHDLVVGADVATRRAVAAMPLDIVMTRAQGDPTTVNDDEEAQLDRDWNLPAPRGFTFRAELPIIAADQEVVAQARSGEYPCVDVAFLDRSVLRARIVSTPLELAQGRVLLQSCDPVLLDSGPHSLRTIAQWRLDRVQMSSPGAEAVAAGGLAPVAKPHATPVPADRTLRITHRTATRIDMEIGAAGKGYRLLRLGEAYDDRWRLFVDGKDAGLPVVLDGYSTGWRIDGRAHRLEAVFQPQGIVEATFTMSLVGVVGLVGVVALPPPPPDWFERLRRRRRSRSGTGAPPAEEET